MPLQVDDDAPLKFPQPQFLTLDNWKRGVITLIDKSRLPRNALQEADNLFLVEDGQPSIRPGVDWFGTAPSADEVDGFDYFDSDGDIHLVVVAGGVVFRSLDDGENWAACTGATLTAGEKVHMNQNGGYLYLTNGADPITRYDGSTLLVTYTALATPVNVSAAKTGLASTTYTYYYKVSAVNRVGFSAASTSDSIAVSLTRDGWDTASNYVTVTWDVVPNATRYDVYLSENDLDYFYLGSTLSTEVSFKDDGTSIPVPSTIAPVDNTTSGPKVEELANVGIVRMFGVRDRDNRHRIWFSSGQINYAGAFSNAFDGGYLDYDPGGKFIPVKVEDYRNGKGDPLATIWCKSADGQGCVVQMSLDTLTVEDISVTIPSAYRLPGSRGTPAPDSVVNVLNDYMFYNNQAFYNLGSRAQYLNLLSTDEASANIRPTVKSISLGEENIAAAYFDAKVYFSVPYGAAENNNTAVFDTERKAWLPKAFTIGFKKFLRYTDTDGIARLLAVKPGDVRLSEISEGIQGDYGQAFTTSLITGLYPTTKNRFEFQWTEEGEVEFSNPQGSVGVELLGIERTRGFRSTNSETIETTLTGVGWDTFGWDLTPWDDTSVVPETFSESSIKRYFNVQKELNALQWHIFTSSLNARYVLRTLQTWGTDTQSGKPRQWRIGSVAESMDDAILDDAGRPILT